MNILMVKWTDANYTDEPKRIDDIEVEMILVTVGIFLKETKTHIVIAAEYCPRINNYKHIICIPKVNIIKKKLIKSNLDGE